MNYQDETEFGLTCKQPNILTLVVDHFQCCRVRLEVFVEEECLSLALNQRRLPEVADADTHTQESGTTLRTTQMYTITITVWIVFYFG